MIEAVTQPLQGKLRVPTIPKPDLRGIGKKVAGVVEAGKTAGGKVAGFYVDHTMQNVATARRIGGAVSGAAGEAVRAASDRIPSAADIRAVLTQIKEQSAAVAATTGEKAQEVFGQSGQFAKDVAAGFVEVGQADKVQAYQELLQKVSQTPHESSLVQGEALRAILSTNIGKAMVAETVGLTAYQLAHKIPLLETALDAVDGIKGLTEMAVRARNVVSGGEAEKWHTASRRSTINVLVGEPVDSPVGEQLDPTRSIGMDDLVRSTPLVLKLAINTAKEAFRQASSHKQPLTAS